MESIARFQVYGLFDPDTDELRYIGQTRASLRVRLQGHLASARTLVAKNCHDYRVHWLNSLLKDGKRPVIRLIEACASVEEMYERERALIAQHHAAGTRLVNTGPGGASNGAAAGTPSARLIGDKTGKVYEGFINPAGERVTIFNMKRFCEEHGLTRKSMMEIYRGDNLSHKGWRHDNSLRPPRNVYEWSGFIRPDGSEEPPFQSLYEFCRRYGLHRSRVDVLRQGKCKSYRGWTYRKPISLAD